MQRTVTVHDVDFDVVYEGTELVPATFDSPAEGGDVDIEEIYIGDQQVDHILPEAITKKIRLILEEGLAEEFADIRNQAEQDRAEARHYEMMEREAA